VLVIFLCVGLSTEWKFPVAQCAPSRSCVAASRNSVQFVPDFGFASLFGVAAEGFVLVLDFFICEPIFSLTHPVFFSAMGTRAGEISFHALCLLLLF
jgi:hypothetical protein